MPDNQLYPCFGPHQTPISLEYGLLVVSSQKARFAWWSAVGYKIALERGWREPTSSDVLTPNSCKAVDHGMSIGVYSGLRRHVERNQHISIPPEIYWDLYHYVRNTWPVGLPHFKEVFLQLVEELQCKPAMPMPPTAIEKIPREIIEQMRLLRLKGIPSAIRIRQLLGESDSANV